MKRLVASVVVILLAAGCVYGSDLLVRSDGGSIGVIPSDDLRGLWVSCQLDGDARLFASELPDSGAAVFGIPVPDTLSGLGFTCAVWRKRVQRCGCDACLARGYHLEGQLAACTARVPTRAIRDAVDDCLASSRAMPIGRGWYALNRAALKGLAQFFQTEGKIVFPSLGPTGLAAYEGLGPCHGAGVPYFLRCGTSEGIHEPTLVMGCQILFGDEAYVNWMSED